jgi:hypothetical protein
MADLFKWAALAVLATAGMGVAAYLTHSYYANQPVACAGLHGCQAVENSDYSTILGCVPAALEGTTGRSPSAMEKADLAAKFDADYKAEYGKDVPALPYVRESYDAVVLIALAAESQVQRLHQDPRRAAEGRRPSGHQVRGGR